MSRHRRIVVALICAVCAAVVIAGHWPATPFVSAIWEQEQDYQDYVQRQGRKARVHPEFVFLGIDQTTLELPPFLPEELANNRALQLMTEKPFPWSREVWAILLDKLFAAGARGLMFDLVFNPPNEGDPIFRQALDRYRDRVVLGANFDLSRDIPQGVVPNPELIPGEPLKDDRVGYIIFFSDATDNKVRSVVYTITDRLLARLPSHKSEEVFYSLTARMLAKLGHAADVPNDFRGHKFRFTENDAYPPVPLYEVFDEKLWRANYGNGAFFKDKVIVLGASSQVAHDFFPTPMSPLTPGPVLHLQALGAALDHDFLHPTSEATNLALVGAAGVLAWLLIAFVRRPLICLLALAAIAAAYLGFGRMMYDRSGLLIVVVPVLTAFLTGGAVSLGFEFVLERMEKVRTRRTLERYVSKNLVREILENPDSFYSSLRGVRIPATILFSDIVGFTAQTETADPEKLVGQLNEYLSRMTAVVFANNGTLDKFIGDGIMAVWGNVRSRGVAEDAKACARAALAMRRELGELNKLWAAGGTPAFQIGVGINHGDVLGGNIGSQEKADPTVIGDAVNLASRLEGLTRSYGVDIMVGERAAALIRDEFVLRSVALVQVKGKKQPVEAFSLIGAKDGSSDPAYLERLETYESGFRKFRERDFAQAKVLFSRFLEFYPEDVLARMYYEKSIEYETENPDAAWNAVEVFHKK